MDTSKETNSVSFGKKGKTIHSGERNIIYNVYNFFKKLSDPLFRENINFNQCRSLCSEATGVSERTVSKICREAKDSFEKNLEVSFLTPGKERERPLIVTGLDDFEKDVVRRCVHEYYDRGEFPTAEKISKDLENRINYKGSVESTRKILKKVGFKFRKVSDGRVFLMERQDIVAARLRFLRTMHDIRSEKDGRPVYYLDETWVNENHTRKYTWQSSSRSGALKVPIGKGKRLIICHVGSANTGFVKECKWVFRSKKNSQDYHDEMNSESFKEWFVAFLNLLEHGSVIVMDNAPYHSVLAEKIPSSSWKKSDIQEWLNHKKIEFQFCETKPELLSRVAPFKSQQKIYELDLLANEMGHTVVRLPPYHCQYNPIELIWAKVKGEVAEKNNTFKITDVEKLMHDALDRVTKDDWIARVQHAENLQREDFEKECARAITIDKIIINLAEDSDSDCDFSDSSDIGNSHLYEKSDVEADEVLATRLREDNEEDAVKLQELAAENPYS